MARFKSALTLFVTVTVVAGLSACSGCNKKSNSRSSPAAVEPEPAPAPAPDPAPAPNPAVGEETPPITNEGPAVIDTEAAASLKHLIFETSDATEAGRYLSEYLIVVRANEDSCVRVKVRPTAGVSDEVDTGAFEGGVTGTDACAGEGWTPPAEPAPAPAPTPTTEGASLRGARPFAPDIVWATPEEQAARGFSLAGQTAAVCSPRLFRMETVGANGASGLGPVISKTGLLRVVGQKVRVWVDEEFYPGCNANAAAGTLASPSYYFGPLIQAGAVPSTWRDALYMDHLQNLASEMDKIVTTIQADYGAVSDIDGGKYIEIFISPDVNRKYFDNVETGSVDQFAADLIYRPEDLAYYDAKANPTSNEGEILYLWAPDPAGIYNQRQYPTANSISSNYAKGFLAAQTMTLIMANQRLLIQKQKSIPDRWLLEGISLLASSYYGGNDYSWRPMAQYLTSRPQYISLTDAPKKELVGEPYLALAHQESLGLRAIFAWYMHSRLCGADTVAPCSALKSLVTTGKTGEAAVEELLALSFKDLTANFGISLGISLIEHPNTAMAFWNKTPLPAGMPKKPTLLPNLAEVRPTAPPTTVEATNTGGLFTPPASPNGNKDRTVAGPFPSKDMLIFQPIAADNDMEFKVAKNSISYIMVTGLIDPNTDMTAYFGKGLNVVFVPIGERDGDMRRIHIEKQSESAHSDLRSDNLTTRAADANRTYMSEQVYPSLDYTVTSEREIWTLGSIDNYKLNVMGTLTELGDTDSYNVEFQPCAGLAGAELTTCQGKEHSAWVQVIVRDFEKELAPMLIVTDSDRSIYRGHSVYDRMKDKITDWTQDQPDSQIYDMLCQAESTWSTTTVTAVAGDTITAPGHTLTNGDTVFFGSDTGLPVGIVSNQPYTVTNVAGNDFKLQDGSGRTVTMTGGGATHWISTGARNVCSNGGYTGKTVFDQTLTQLDPLLFAHNYDNFLQLGYYGFPFTTRGTQSYKDMPECPNYLCYYTGESTRQHIKFAFDKDVKPNTFRYHTSPRFLTDFDELSRLDTDMIGKFGGLKNRMDTCPASPVPSDNPDSESVFVEECSKLPGMNTDLCSTICTDFTNVQATVINALQDSYLACTSSFCAQEDLLARPGPRTSEWIDSDRYFWTRNANSTTYTYYMPIQPVARDSYCGGDAGNPAPYQRCAVKSDSIFEAKDIRQQLNVSVAQTRFNCMYDLIGTDFKVCYDPLSYDREIDPNDAYAYWTVSQILPSDRNAQLPVATYTTRREAAIYARAGEVTAKPERLNAVLFKVPGTGTVANIMIGGRQKSQGKYLLRARIMPFP